MLDLGEIKARQGFIRKHFGYPADLHATIRRLMMKDLPSLIEEVEELRIELGKEKRLRIAWENQCMSKPRS